MWSNMYSVIGNRCSTNFGLINGFQERLQLWILIVNYRRIFILAYGLVM